MLYLNHSVKIVGFAKDELLNIQATSLFEASKILGSKTKEITHDILGKNLKFGKKKHLQKCVEELEIIENLSKRGHFTIGKVNYGKRYLEALKGFSEGAEVTIPEAIFLQKEIQAGCQTMISKNEDGSFSVLHTEENAADDNTLPNYDYRIVNMKFADKEVVFFAYPGICGWGSAFGVDKTNLFVQFVDDLLIGEKFLGGLWSNMITFMLFDTGNIKRAELLLEKISLVGKKYGFSGGYAVHMIQNKSKSSLASYEFGGNLVKKISNFAKLFAQVNYSKNDSLKKMTEFYPPKILKKWGKYQKQTYLEMTRREVRLLDLEKMGLWKTSTADKTIQTGLQVLAYPYGDIRKYRGKDGKLVYYHTGLPGRWTFAHFVGYIGKYSKFYIGKKNPSPTKGMEYSNDIDENYIYGEEKIWKL